MDRVDDPDDARLKRLRVTARGREMTRIGAATFDELRSRWAATLPAGAADEAEEALRLLAGARAPGATGTGTG